MKKLNYLDSIRGIACIIVVLSHLSLVFFPYILNFRLSSIPSDNYIQNFIHNSPISFLFSGTSAVYVFFVLSGIVLSKSVQKKNDREIINVAIFRYFRLAIPALTSCIISYVVFSYLVKDNSNVLPWLVNKIVETPSLINAIYDGLINAFFLSGSEYNVVLWTMKIEFFGSILIYFFSCTHSKINPFLNAIIFLIISVFTVIFSKLTAMAFLSFWFGFVIFKFKFVLKNTMLQYMSLVVGLYFAGAHNDSESYLFISYFLGDKTYAICNGISGIFIVMFFFSNKKSQDFLNKNWLVKIGHLSFPIYLIHMSAIIIGVNYIFPLLESKLNFDLAAIICSFFVFVIMYCMAKPMVLIDRLSVKLSKKLNIYPINLKMQA